MTVNDLERVRVGDRDMVRSQTDDSSILVVDLMDMLTPFPLSCPVAQPEVAELGHPWAWEVAYTMGIYQPRHYMGQGDHSGHNKQTIDWVLL